MSDPDPRRLRDDAVGGPLARESRGNRAFYAVLGVVGLLTAIVCIAVVVWLPISIAVGATTVSAGIGAMIALFVVLPLCAAAGVWMFVNYTVRNLRDQRSTDEAIARDGALPPLHAPSKHLGTIIAVVSVGAVILAFGIPALALLDR